MWNKCNLSWTQPLNMRMNENAHIKTSNTNNNPIQIGKWTKQNKTKKCMIEEIAAGALYQVTTKKKCNQHPNKAGIEKTSRKHLIGSVCMRSVNWITFSLVDYSYTACNWKKKNEPYSGIQHGYSQWQYICVVQFDSISLSIHFFCLIFSRLDSHTLCCINSPIYYTKSTVFFLLAVGLLLLFLHRNTLSSRWANLVIFNLLAPNAFRLCVWVWKLFVVRKITHCIKIVSHTAHHELTPLNWSDDLLAKGFFFRLVFFSYFLTIFCFNGIYLLLLDTVAFLYSIQLSFDELKMMHWSIIIGKTVGMRWNMRTTTKYMRTFWKERKKTWAKCWFVVFFLVLRDFIWYNIRIDMRVWIW